MIKKYHFLDIVTDITSKFKKVKKSDYLSEGQIRIIDQSQDQIAGYSDDVSLVKPELSPVIIFGDHTKVFKYEKDPLILGADGTKALKVNTTIAHDLYVYYFLKTINFQDAGYSRYFKFLKKIKIPIPVNDDDKPKVDEQACIAILLSKVESLIAKRKKSIVDLDELLKSAFLDMFSIKNEGFKKWRIDNLTKHSEVVSGVAKGKKYNKTKMIEIPYLRVANVQDGFLNLDEVPVKTIFVSEREIDKCLLKCGDVLLTEGGDPDKLGRGSVWRGEIENCIHQNHIFRVRIIDKKILNPQYLSGLIGSVYGKAYFLKSAKQTTGIASINSTQLKNFPVILPPIDLQNQFATIVEKVQTLKENYQNNLNDLETLYGALSQKAFKGELDLSRIPITVELKPKDITIDAPQVEKPDLAVQGEPVKTQETREQILQRLFNGFISDARNGALTLDDFWRTAEETFTELLDEDASPLGAADYDRVRDWLFDLLAQGSVAQVFNEEENRMEIRSVP